MPVRPSSRAHWNDRGGSKQSDAHKESTGRRLKEGREEETPRVKERTRHATLAQGPFRGKNKVHTQSGQQEKTARAERTWFDQQRGSRFAKLLTCMSTLRFEKIKCIVGGRLYILIFLVIRRTQCVQISHQNPHDHRFKTAVVGTPSRAQHLQTRTHQHLLKTTRADASRPAVECLHHCNVPKCPKK